MAVRDPVCLLAVAIAVAVLPAMGDEPPVPTQISSEDCLDCKHLRCLESLLKERLAIANAYDQIANGPTIQVRDESGRSVDVVDDTKFSAAERTARIQEILSKLQVYKQAERRNLERITPAECGAPASEDVTAETDPIKCEIQPGLQTAMAAMPCKQLAEMVRTHEINHSKECDLRKHHSTDPWPYKWPTPTGLAHEEVASYRTEAATIQKLIDKIQEPRLESEAVSIMRVPGPMGTIRMTQTGLVTFKVSEGTPQTVTGEGETSMRVDTSGSQCSVTGNYGTGKFKVSGQISGGVATLRVTEMEPKTTTVRVRCPGGYGFPPPVPKTPGTMQVNWKDGESVSKTLVDMPQATVKSSYTLHLKCKRPQGA
jgi:hypothetical protein